MIAGPWTNRDTAYRAWGKFIRIKNIDGKAPQAVERRNGAVRLLYTKPADDRERLPVFRGLFEYAWDGN